MPFTSPSKLRNLARAAALALALPSSASFAQDANDNSGPPASGAPRNIVPVEQLPAPVTAPLPAPSPGPLPEVLRAPVIPGRAALAVQVGDLGTLEGPVAGTLDNMNGGLGPNAWQGSDRATVVTMLQSVPAATPSAAQRL